MSVNLIAHVEIPSTNLNTTTDFFEKVFDWKFKPFGKGYLLYNTHNQLTVGLRKVDSVSNGDTTIFHIRIDNIDKILEKAEKEGGSIFRGKKVIPAMGYYALIKDPDGNTIGLYQGN